MNKLQQVINRSYQYSVRNVTNMLITDHDSLTDHIWLIDHLDPYCYLFLIINHYLKNCLQYFLKIFKKCFSITTYILIFSCTICSPPCTGHITFTL